MQLVQPRMRWLTPFTCALTGWRLTFHRRRVVLWAWEMLLPNCGPLPQRSHLAAMTIAPISYRRSSPEIEPGVIQGSNGAVDAVGHKKIGPLTSTVSRDSAESLS